MNDRREQIGDLARKSAERVSLRGRGAEHERRDFTITKFGRHADGYFHARVTPSGGRAVYVHCKFGSWMAPGTIKGKSALKEVVKEVAVELVKRAKTEERRERRKDEPDQDDSSERASDGATAGDDIRDEGGSEGSGNGDESDA